MKRTLTYLAAAGALTLAACFPVVASAWHGHGDHGGHGGHDRGDHGWGGDGPRWAHGGGHGMVGVVVVGIRVTESMPAQAMAITLIPTSALPRDTAGIHALTMSMGTNRA